MMCGGNLMWKRALVVGLVLFASSGLMVGQVPGLGGLPNATVGVPYSVDLSEVLFGGFLQEIQAIESGAGVSLSITFSASGSLPPGLALSGSVLSGTPSQAGTYPVGVSIVISASYMGFNETLPIQFPLSLEVDGFTGGTL